MTYFFNGGKEEPFEGEDRVMVPSPRVATYDLKPDMSAHEVSEVVIGALKSEKYDFIVVNFAENCSRRRIWLLRCNGRGCEDRRLYVGRIVEKARSIGWTVMITADHGNADEVKDPSTRDTSTAHSLNPVPFIVIGEGDIKLREDGDFGDVAPTVLDALGIEKPAAMTGRSLIIR